MADHWNEANGGLRGSTFLRLGALAYPLAALTHFAGRYLSPGAAGPENPYFLLALLMWDAALFLVAAGFLWTGINPILSRYGLAPGLFTAVQAVYTLVSLVSPAVFFVPPMAVNLGRTFLVGLFVVIERAHLSRPAILLLGLGSLLQFLRIILRSFGVVGTLPGQGELLIGALFMLMTAAGLFLVARDLRRHEEDWALANRSMRDARFAAFNNPLHEKNRVPRSRDA